MLPFKTTNGLSIFKKTVILAWVKGGQVWAGYYSQCLGGIFMYHPPWVPGGGWKSLKGGLLPTPEVSKNLPKKSASAKGKA